MQASFDASSSAARARRATAVRSRTLQAVDSSSTGSTTCAERRPLGDSEPVSTWQLAGSASRSLLSTCFLLAFRSGPKRCSADFAALLAVKRKAFPAPSPREPAATAFTWSGTSGSKVNVVNSLVLTPNRGARATVVRLATDSAMSLTSRSRRASTTKSQRRQLGGLLEFKIRIQGVPPRLESEPRCRDTVVLVRLAFYFRFNFYTCLLNSLNEHDSHFECPVVQFTKHKYTKLHPFNITDRLRSQRFR